MASNYYGSFTYAGVQQGDTFVPSATDASVDARHEAAYTSDAGGQDSGVYGYVDPQGISYPAYGQSGDGTQSAGIQYPAYNSSGYNNSYNQAVSDYATAALSYGYSSGPSGGSSYSNYSQSKTRPVFTQSRSQGYGSGPRATVPADQQIYCDICKISCVSQQAFSAHLKGQQHQKKKKAADSSTPGSGNGNEAKPVVQNQNPVLMTCALCEVPCSGPEAYSAHIRGSKHQKVLTLHQRMGKPIPALPPVPVLPATTAPASALRVMGTPTMNFKDGGCLSTTDNKPDATDGQAEGSADQSEASIAAMKSLDEVIAQAKNNSGTNSSPSPSSIPFKRPEPIGEQYVHSVSPKDGKPASFYCQICECEIGDTTARDQHLRGKRHRYSYKTKVDSRIEAEVFPKPRPNATDGSPGDGQTAASPSTKPATPSFTQNQKNFRPASRTAPPYPPSYVSRVVTPGHNNWSYGNRNSGYSQNYGNNYNWNQAPVARPPMPRFRPPAAGYAPRYPPHNPYGPMAGMSPNYGPRQPFGRMPVPRHPYQQPNYGYYPSPPVAQYPPRPPVRPFRMTPAPPEPMHQPEAGPSDLHPIPLTEDDHLLLKKHTLICPPAEELEFLFKLLNTVEEALKLVSDDLMVPVKQEENGDADSNETKAPTRVLKGLMRVGPAAEELLLSGDDAADVVVMCAEKPTKGLQQQVLDLLPVHMATLSDSKNVTVALDYTIRVSDIMSSGKGKKWSVRISLTSPLMRAVNTDTESMQVDGNMDQNVEEGTAAAATASTESLESSEEEKVAAAGDPPDAPHQQPVDQDSQSEMSVLLDRSLCLSSLAEVRRAKWFQAKMAELDPAPIVMRILLDLRRRHEVWSQMDTWPLLLLCERVIVCQGEPVSPSEAFRSLLEAISSGILMPDGPGLVDPCEKDLTDALHTLSHQTRADVTHAAQRCLRLVAFHQIHRILGLNFQSGSAVKKRRILEEPAPEPEAEPVVPMEPNFAEDDD